MNEPVKKRKVILRKVAKPTGNSPRREALAQYFGGTWILETDGHWRDIHSKKELIRKFEGSNEYTYIDDYGQCCDVFFKGTHISILSH